MHESILLLKFSSNNLSEVFEGVMMKKVQKLMILREFEDGRCIGCELLPPTRTGRSDSRLSPKRADYHDS
jgi:hypothetical protein